jgi:hypothetical protein
MCMFACVMKMKYFVHNFSSESRVWPFFEREDDFLREGCARVL